VFNLGHTRSDRQPTHLLQTPDTFIGMPLPGFDSVTVIVHAAPAIGAAFTQYTAEFESGGSLGPAHGQRFVYVLEGGVTVALGGQTHQLGPGGYGHMPANQQHTVKATTKSRVAVIEKPAISLPNDAPAAAHFGNENEVVSQPLGGDEALQVKQLLPTVPGLDYAVTPCITSLAPRWLWWKFTSWSMACSCSKAAASIVSATPGIRSPRETSSGWRPSARSGSEPWASSRQSI